MKKTKLLPLLVAAPMLVSCGIAKPTKGGFVKVSDADKVTSAKFVEEISKEQEKIDFYSTKALPSSEAKIESKYLLKADVKRGKRTLRSIENGDNEKAQSKFDKANQIIAFETTSKENISFKSDAMSRAETFDNKSLSTYQVSKVGNDKHLLYVDNSKKEYWSRAKFESTDKPEETVDSYAKGFIEEMAYGVYGYTLSDLVGMYMGSSEEEQKDFTFYKKDRVYTIEYSFEEKDKDVIEDEKVVAKETIIKFYKAQVVFEDGKNKEVHYSSYETK
jgi:hypothetical protein